MKYSLAPFLLANLLCCSFFIGLSVIPAKAVPVLQDRAKRPVGCSLTIHASKTMASLPVASSQELKTLRKNILQEIKVLGSYQDISPYKKNIEAARPELALVEQTVPDAKPDIDTEQNRPQGSNNLQKKISAKSAFVMNAANGQTLFAVFPDTPRQPASTIKILTGLIAIKSLNFSEAVAVSSKAAGQPSSKIYLKKEKQYKANDLINAVLLSSANDASVALAEKIAGSEQSFARMMTLRAKLCGAQNTICKTANGLTAEGQSTTARDLATIFKHAMQDEQFSQRMKQVKTHTAEGKLLRNHNKALWQIAGAEGGKTGFTNAAGQTYVGKFKRGSKEIIVAIMGSRTMWADLKTLVEYGFSQQESTIAKTIKDKEKPRVIAGIPVVSRRQ
jgi:D-alanyl-D-alanine carboxypeptidase (penicillin-binding protein 5/6)